MHLLESRKRPRGALSPLRIHTQDDLDNPLDTLNFESINNDQVCNDKNELFLQNLLNGPINTSEQNLFGDTFDKNVDYSTTQSDDLLDAFINKSTDREDIVRPDFSIDNNNDFAVSSIQIQNVIASFQLNAVGRQKPNLDLRQIAISCRLAEYNPRKINACIVRFRNPKSTALIFRSGRVMLAGAESEHEAHRASRILVKMVQAVLYGKNTRQNALNITPYNACQNEKSDEPNKMLMNKENESDNILLNKDIDSNNLVDNAAINKLDDSNNDEDMIFNGLNNMDKLGVFDAQMMNGAEDNNIDAHKDTESSNDILCAKGGTIQDDNDVLFSLLNNNSQLDKTNCIIPASDTPSTRCSSSPNLSSLPLERSESKHIYITNFIIENVVATADCGLPVRLEGLAFDHKEFCSYEPELFAGLVYRYSPTPTLKAVIMVFVSGKIVITGCKSASEIREVFESFYPVLLKYHT